MHRTLFRQGNAALIAGILMVLLVAGLFKFLWLTIHAPIVWVVLAAWIVIPILPFALRLFNLETENVGH